ncbi:hypothetical protein IPJ72_03615 [Candidatus Peregrinibacteria bacterium]|nr:MAG: hypothetical protein IPJ72_03615 [Candidatus Peregrinibacteria bacterium]
MENTLKSLFDEAPENPETPHTMEDVMNALERAQLRNMNLKDGMGGEVSPYALAAKIYKLIGACNGTREDIIKALKV